MSKHKHIEFCHLQVFVQLDMEMEISSQATSKQILADVEKEKHIRSIN